jgi:type I restriction enzyme M protein
VQGKPVVDDFASIADAFAKRQEPWWSECKFQESYYYVPRFYHQGANRSVEQYAKEADGRVLTIGQLLEATYLRIRKGNEVGSEAYGTGDIPFVRTSDVNNWEVCVEPTNGVSEEIYEQFKHVQKLKAGDILLVVDGRYKIGRSAILHSHNCRCVVQSHLRILSVSQSSPVTNYELLYLLNLPCVLDEMRNLVFIQSTLGSIGRRLERLRIPIPRRSIEWNTQIENFRALLDARAQQLARLQSIRTPEPEL